MPCRLISTHTFIICVCVCLKMLYRAQRMNPWRKQMAMVAREHSLFTGRNLVQKQAIIGEEERGAHDLTHRLACTHL